MKPTRSNTRNLAGSDVVITGAGSGIGRELALLSAQRGARLAICDVDASGLDVTAVCPGVINTPITANSAIRGDDGESRRERLQALYQRRGYTAERVAQNVLKAVEADRAVAPIAAEAHVLYAISRAVPPASRWLSARMAALSK